MKVLAVKQPWASWIADKEKTLEIRSRNTNIRERIAIYATRSPQDERVIYKAGLSKGYIIATTEIINSTQYTDAGQILKDACKHKIPLNDFTMRELTGFYAWELSNVQKLKHPIKFKMRKGCVVWDKIDDHEIRLANMDVI